MLCSLDFKLLFQLASSEKSQLYVLLYTAHCESSRYSIGLRIVNQINTVFFLVACWMTSQLRFVRVIPHSIYPRIYISFGSLRLFMFFYSNACWNERPLTLNVNLRAIKQVLVVKKRTFSSKPNIKWKTKPKTVK